MNRYVLTSLMLITLISCGQDMRKRRSHLLPAQSSPLEKGDHQKSDQLCAEIKITYTNPGHNHTIIKLSPNQVTEGRPGNYTLLGGDHAHQFLLREDDFQALKEQSSVLKEDNEGHGHIIKIEC